MHPYRRLAYRFLTLPYHVKVAIAQELDLLRDEDQRVTDSKWFASLFERARTENRLAALRGGGASAETPEGAPAS